MEMLKLQDADTTTVKLSLEDETIAVPDVLQDKDENDISFLLLPLAVLLGILALSALVYLMARNRRRIAHLYCKRRYTPINAYSEEDSESALDQADDFDFDDPTECLLKGKLQIDNRHENYQTTVTQSAAGRSELYT